MKATLHFEMSRATRTLDRATFKDAKAAAAWCVAAVVRHAQTLKDEGAEIYFSLNKTSFVTDGGDEAEANWNWTSDEVDSSVYAELRGRDM